MSKIIGRLRKVGLAKEAVKGTGVVPSFWLPVVSSEMNPIIDKKMREGAIGRIEGAYEDDIVAKRNEPSIEGYVTDKAVGLLLLAAFGQVSSQAQSAPNGSVYDHTFSVKNDTDHPSLSLSFKDDNLAKWVRYAMLNSLDLSAVVGEYLTYAASFVGKFEADQALTPAVVSENIFVARHASVKVADDLASLDAASAITLQAVKLQIAKNVEAVGVLGSDEPGFIVNKQFDIKGSLEIIESDTTWRALFAANTSKALRIEIENSDVTIGSSAHPKIKIDIAKVKFNPYSEDVGLGDLLKETVEFSGLYSITDTKSIEGVLTNLQASY